MTVLQSRRTKIVVTLGPACESEETLRAMVLAGMNVARLNLSHGTHEQHAATAQRLRRIAAGEGKPVALLLDLQGPKIRTGLLEGRQTVELQTGSDFAITIKEHPGSSAEVSTSFRDLPRDVKVGDRILLDDGNIELRVQDTSADTVYCTVVHGGVLGEHKGINLPGVVVSAPVLTTKDESDLRFGLDLGVDYVALSFVRSAHDVVLVRQIMRSVGKSVPVIAKLEKPEAISHLEAIISAFDGVMVARGDLGVELSPEQVPILQKRIIGAAQQAGKVVITATQMLESMTHAPRPTRAEASDVANAICDGTDAVMLSGETASGDYPAETVRMMDRIARYTESAEFFHVHTTHTRATHAHAVTHAACTLAQEVRAQAVVVFTRSGASAHLVSKWKPSVPVYAYTGDETTYRQLALWWGIEPVLFPFEDSTDYMVSAVSRDLLEDHRVEEGGTVVIVGSTPLLVRGRTNFIKLQTIRRGRS
ncbi:MAG: pyruvate kinase [Chloroflexi bacterium]|nr:pyruvate kinase [Chloroflexota bacterium]